MKRIKRTAAFVLTLLMLFSLAACGQKANDAEAGGEDAAPETAPVETAAETEPSVEPSPEPTPEPTPRLTAGPAIITGDGVYFRNGPDTGERVIAIYNKGKPVTIIRVEGDWVVAEIDGVTGYLNGAYVEMDESVQTMGSGGEAEGEPGYINIDGVNFRSGPSVSSEKIATYPLGTPVTIIGENGDWLTVIINGRRGYIYAEYVTRSSEPSPTPAPSATPKPTGGGGGGNGGGGGGNDDGTITVEPAPTPAPTATPTPSGGDEIAVEQDDGGGDVVVDDVVIEP